MLDYSYIRPGQKPGRDVPFEQRPIHKQDPNLARKLCLPHSKVPPSEILPHVGHDQARFEKGRQQIREELIDDLNAFVEQDVGMASLRNGPARFGVAGQRLSLDNHNLLKMLGKDPSAQQSCDAAADYNCALAD